MSNDPIISQEDMAALLGRPLSDVEKQNYSLYLQIAILRLDDLLCIKLEDMTDIPADLQLLIARCFATVIAEQAETASHGITNKKVEDFSISFDVDAKSPMVAFVAQNTATIDKYGQCQGPIRTGGACLPCTPCRECCCECL